jgi:DNA-binding response OmpR family regulator
VQSEGIMTNGDIKQPYPERIAPSRVLIVEDDRDVRETMCVMLAEAGSQVTCAADHRSALQLLQESRQPFQLAIVDLRLPGGVSGAQLGRQIYKASAAAILLISGDHERLTAESRDHPEVVCLEKPFGLSKLLSAAAAAMALHEKGRVTLASVAGPAVSSRSSGAVATCWSSWPKNSSVSN